MIDIKEMLRRAAGQSARHVARETGLDRKTVGRYFDAAATLPLPLPCDREPTEEEIHEVAKRVQLRPSGRGGTRTRTEGRQNAGAQLGPQKGRPSAHAGRDHLRDHHEDGRDDAQRLEPELGVGHEHGAPEREPSFPFLIPQFSAC
jgi:hypothetical protein